MKDRRIFCFWEPAGTLPAYLELCLRTWDLHLPGYEIIRLNYSNLDQYITPGTYDLTTLKRVALAAQKDAIMVAALREHGGIFMDIDTLVTRDIAPIARKLAHTDLVLFDTHLAFAVARPNSPILDRWVTHIAERIARLNQPDPPTPEWHYLGNGPLADVMHDMIDGSLVGRAYRGLAKAEASWPAPARTLWRKLPERVWQRRKGLFFRTAYRKYLTMLDRRAHAFIAEARFFGKTTSDPRDEYLEFWFQDRQDAEHAFPPEQRLIGLHNSWTPEWYKALSQTEVVEHPCLLSRTIRRVLGG